MPFVKAVGSQCNTRCKTCKCGQMMTKGRPCGTSQRAGCSVSKSGGKPHGITVNEGYNVGGQARPDSMKSELARFSPESPLILLANRLRLNSNRLPSLCSKTTAHAQSNYVLIRIADNRLFQVISIMFSRPTR